MFFRRKNDFKPDKTHAAGVLSPFYITKKQRLTLLKWVLMALVLVALSVLQDVILSQVRIFGSTTDLVSAAILMVCIMLDPEAGAVFTLISALCYEFSGAAPGAYVIALITVLGLLLSIFRHGLLREGFGATILVTVAAVVLYQMAIFSIGCFLGHTTISRLPDYLGKAALSAAAMPAVYPVFSAVSKIGGDPWKE